MGSRNEELPSDGQLKRDLADFGERGFVNSAAGLEVDPEDAARVDRDRAMQKFQKAAEVNEFRSALFSDDMLTAKKPAPTLLRPVGPAPAAPAGKKLPGFLKMKSKDNFEQPPEKRPKLDAGEASPPDAGAASPASSAPASTPLGLGGYDSSSEEEG
eukprot:CAMPEP_0197659356 /NCGR_PEP_ID=MMETSP1338-20131121/47382_1 /TAXON_ID=43686 ORGANISM="Pelagodinium beii, Strain RCC1491" /NCGR_SAMPLE_ID=MMETSP1338 /ASSEMBLY_ACC=CAM_ASM_000754 /LENGTH=156 /DNA_ID=CAMNT_0043236251 /DNA_START=43 /DNA_END=513 /DNA_ORIENTATION=-